MQKLTVAVIQFAAGLAFASTAHADPDLTPFRGFLDRPQISEEQHAPCDPNYAGACVPVASDVDCAGGSGNGPAYVEGPVTVIGKDIYHLDSDGDGIGCE